MSVVELEHPHPGVALVRLNRPEARNALNDAMRLALAALFRKLADDDVTRCVVVTGNEKAFAAGADLKEFRSDTPVELLQRRVLRLWQAIAGCPKPIIAAVNGYALGGGCELALHADIIVVGENAVIGQPEAKVGVIPGGGATQRLGRAIGKYRAMKLVLTGEPISGREAAAMGLASEAVPDAEVLPRSLELARTIAQLPPLAMMAAKEVMLAGADASLYTGLLLERRSFELLFASEDQKEGMSAFFEKRRPEFKGR
jgi:enoyl-CoA hydratase/carnithine racemase